METSYEYFMQKMCLPFYYETRQIRQVFQHSIEKVQLAFFHHLNILSLDIF